MEQSTRGGNVLEGVATAGERGCEGGATGAWRAVT